MLDPIVSKAILVIDKLELKFHLSYNNSFKTKERNEYSNSDVKRVIVKNANNQSEMNYLFVDKVLKQIKLLLI